MFNPSSTLFIYLFIPVVVVVSVRGRRHVGIADANFPRVLNFFFFDLVQRHNHKTSPHTSAVHSARCSVVVVRTYDRT